MKPERIQEPSIDGTHDTVQLSASDIDRMAQEIAVKLPLTRLQDLSRVQEVEAILKLFQIEHLPPELQRVSRPFGELAGKVAVASPESPETLHCLRKLLEAKDCAVRAAIAFQPTDDP